jgi:uncharacterized protein YjbI with pentapeptide repeats
LADDGSQQRQYWRNPVVSAAIGVAATLVVTVAVVLTLLLTSGVKAIEDNAGVIGALVGLGGVFTTQLVSIALEDRREQESRHIEAQRTQESRHIEAQRTQAARALEAQRAYEAALQNYFEQVGKLIIEQPVHRARLGDNLSTVVRAQTLSVLEGLDPHRKGILLMFLYDSGLILREKTVVSLVGSDLSEADLSEAYLSQTNLSMADLSGANLNKVTLIDADLRGTDLSGANLSDTVLAGADLSAADISEAFRSLLTYFGTADRLPMTKYATDLSGANLSNAVLAGADLSAAEGITNEELEQQALSLEGATMPTGQKYEDWLKEKEGRRKDGANGGPS